MWRKISRCLLLFLTVSGVFLSQTIISIPSVRGVTWSSGVAITPTGSLEDKPYVIQDSQSSLWVAYESSRTGNWDIYMRQYNGVSWQPEQQMTTDPGSDLTPALVQLANGNVMMVWASDRAGNFSLYSKTKSAGTWSGDTRLTAPQGRDSTPSLLQLRNGTLWLMWTRESLSGGSVVRYLYSKTYNNGGWSPEARFSSGGSEEEPSLIQSDDGNIWVMYAAIRFGNLDVFYKTYNGGWSAENRLTSDTNDDHQPWLMQDLSGVLWAFWNRCVPSGSQTCEDDVFYETSTNLGVTWSAEVQFTIDPAGYTIYDSHPTAVHYSRDKMIYVFWGTDLTGLGTDFDVWLEASNPMPIHDVSLANPVAAPSSLTESGVIKVNFTANNPGDYRENVTINGYYQSQTSLIFKSTTISLMPGASAFMRWSWNTSKVVPATYKLSLVALPVPGESVRLIAGNTAVAGNATILPVREDINKDGRVDIIDVAAVAFKFGTKMGAGDIDHDCDIDITDVAFVAYHYGTVAGGPNWNPLADLNGDGRVDILDIALVASNFGQAIGPTDINHDCVINIIDVADISFWYGFGT